MKRDALKTFVLLRQSLLREKEKLERRLEDINHALASEGVSRGKQGRGLKNKISLKDAIIKATRSKPLNKDEILEAVRKMGYVFTTTNPKNSIGVVLYGRNPKFKNNGGKFNTT